MIEYFNTHIYAFWFAVGFILLAVELLVLGFATGFVLFLGLAALVTGGFLWAKIIPVSWLGGIVSFTLSSVLISAALWKPFNNLQHSRQKPEKDNTSDLIGYEFRLTEDISIMHPGKTRYSGIEWRVEIDNDADVESIASGTLVVVTSVDAGKFRVVSAS